MKSSVDFWDARYGKEAFAYGMHPNVFFKEELSKMDAGLLLLPCEGEGRNAVFSAQLGWEVIAVDSSEQGREKAMNFAAQQQVEINYLNSDITGLNFPENTYNAIGLIYAHFNATARKLLHEKLAHALKPKGRIILEAFSKEQFGRNSGGPKILDMLYSKEELLEDFSGLSIVHAGEYEIDLDEGEFHQGKAKIVRIVAEKE